MSDESCMPAVGRAREWLATFPARERSRGESLFQRGQVLEWVESVPLGEYSAVVRDGGQQEVDLYYDPESGWEGFCTCEEEVDCRHAYAATKVFLERMGQLGGAALELGGPPVPAVVPPPKQAKMSFAERVAAGLGRPLAVAERLYVQMIERVYRRTVSTRTLTSWDLDELGLRLRGGQWGELRLWPSLPKDECEFWLYVASAARAQGVSIPKFMVPVSDPAPIADRLRAWQRRDAIATWTRTLEQAALVPPPAGGPVASVEGEYDARLRFGEKGAVLEWKRPGETSFTPVPAGRLRQSSGAGSSELRLPPEAEVLWLQVSLLDRGHKPNTIPYDAPDASPVLNALIRNRALASRLVTADGVPLAWRPEPLRWDLIPAQSEAEDYGLRLVRADGTPAPAPRLVLPGSPVLYVTDAEVFAGPAVSQAVLDPCRQHAIPAPALETRHGALWLHRLGVPMPPRLEGRVRTVPLALRIRCEVKPSYPNSPTEECLVHLQAVSSDGRATETWTGSAWLDAAQWSRARQAVADDDCVVVYDRSALARGPALLGDLPLKWNAYTGALGWRVTRKFGEQFAAWLRSLPPEIPVELGGELASFRDAAIAGSVRLEVAEAEIDWFDLRVALEVSDTTLSEAELKLLLDAQGALVRLKGKGWRRLAFQLTPEEDERLAQLGLSPHGLSSEPQRLHALQLADEATRKLLPPAQAEQIERRAAELKARVTPALPAGVEAALRPYQTDGFHFLAYLAANRFGGILADDMGLGKTLQTLVWLAWLHAAEAGAKPGGRARAAAPALVVCPKSVMDNWRVEAARFTPGLRVRVWAAAELDQFQARLGEAELHVLNYSQLRILGEALVSVRWRAVVLDEGQYIKNPSSVTAQVARALRAEHRLVLTGTPIENRLLDLWSLMAYVMPGVLGSRQQFARLYDAKGDPLARRRLSARVRPFLLRRTKTQVAKDLPDRIEEDLYCELEGEQALLYRAELKRAQQILLRVTTQQELARERFHFLTSLLRLRQICCHPALVKPDSTAPSAKLEALTEQLEPLMQEGHKVLVFSQFVDMIRLLETALARRGWRYFVLTGETEDRGALVQDFQTAEGSAVFLISLKAGGFGLNLTAASYVVLYDPWWNPAVERQAIDRTHRIGQTETVIAYRLLIRQSIEEKIRALQQQKRALVEDVLGEERFAESLTLADLQFLLADSFA